MSAILPFYNTVSKINKKRTLQVHDELLFFPTILNFSLINMDLEITFPVFSYSRLGTFYLHFSHVNFLRLKSAAESIKRRRDPK